MVKSIVAAFRRHPSTMITENLCFRLSVGVAPLSLINVDVLPFFEDWPPNLLLGQDVDSEFLDTMDRQHLVRAGG